VPDPLALLEPSPPAPWTRFWARYVDGILAGFCLTIVTTLAGVDTSNWAIQAFSIWSLLCWIPIDALLLSAFGRTPGKWLLGVSVSCPNGTRPHLGVSLVRALKVAFYGQALNFSVIKLFTLLAGFNRLKNEGITSWDRECVLVVRHGKVGTASLITVILLVCQNPYWSFGALERLWASFH
jgi:uncharacterized RDD family membrane protein YckC